jgi:hypothetical protein
LIRFGLDRSRVAGRQNLESSSSSFRDTAQQIEDVVIAAARMWKLDVVDNAIGFFL